MTDQISPEIHPEVVENEIKKISAEILREREKPESKNLTSKELIRQTMRSYVGVGQPPAKSPEPARSGEEIIDNVLPKYAESAPPEIKEKIERFLEMAFREGILKASSEAAKSGPFVLDAFHDALSGKLYEELNKRGLLG